MSETTNQSHGHITFSDLKVHTSSESRTLKGHNERRSKRSPYFKPSDYSRSYRMAVDSSESSDNFYDIMHNLNDYVDTSAHPKRKDVLKIVTFSRFSYHQRAKFTVMTTVTLFTFLSISSLFVYLYVCCKRFFFVKTFC
jgi:hypothetical protein